MKYVKITLLVIISVIFLLGVAACTKNNLATDTVDKPTVKMNTDTDVDFKYPEKSDFIFETDKNNVTVRNGENITIKCSLKNASDRDYYVEYGVEVITYSYNDFSETLNAIAVLDIFKSNSEYNRNLEITANKSGKITVSATIYVKPSQYSDQYEIYSYEKEIVVDVGS